MLSKAKARAKQLGLEFDLSVEDIVIPTLCPVLQVPIVIADGKQDDGSPTLDRIDSSKGYVKGNVAVISWRANCLKRDATIEEMRSVLMYMETHLSGEPNDSKIDPNSNLGDSP